jgi:hypothetical protein
MAAVNTCKFLLAVAASGVFGAGCGFAGDLATIRLPGKIAADAEVGLAVSATDSLYAGYWVQSGGNQPWQLMIYRFDAATGKVLSKAEVDKAQPPRSRNGDPIQSEVRLWISADSLMLLCTTIEHGPVRKCWTLSSHDLRVLGSGTVPADTEVLGFGDDNDVRFLRVHKGGTFGQEIDSATVLSVNAHSLDQGVSEHVIHFEEPGWQLIALGPDNLLWVFDERTSERGDARITAYGLPKGELIVTREVSFAQAEVGVPATAPRSQGIPLPPPSAIPQPGHQGSVPQLAQMIGASQGVLGILHQPVRQWKPWSRLFSVGVTSKGTVWSSVLNDCNLLLDTVGRSGRMAIGSCDVIERGPFDQYEIKKSDAVFVSTQNASILAVLPLSTRRPPLSLAIDDGTTQGVAAIYDRRGTVRIVAIPM